ncbi:hypothetical protein LTR36_002311 [Oleoguttula mirabilis]|uniref:Uncharacterized protein n=1 Tax=Oleoguttula mirabilis TaxID=1507867 RepID=A0AAV9JM94_9PEZI|nr:hypothetical protein LTR36_002311 [Oleoguttula mirabilis]
MMSDPLSEYTADMMYSTCDFQCHTGHWLPIPSDLAEDSRTTPTSQKRKASSPLESEPAKKARGDDGDEAADNTAEMFVEAMEHVEAQRAEVERTRSELEEVKEERDEWRLKFFGLEDDIKEIKRSRGSKEGDTMAQMKDKSRKLEESIKQKWEQKLQTQKEAADDKYDDLRFRFNKQLRADRQKFDTTLQARDAKLKKEKAELIAKNQKEISEMKQKTFDDRQEFKKDKDDLAQLKKKLKEEQQAEIHKHKPETALAVKEKTQQLKEKQIEIKKLQGAYGKQKDRAELLEKVVDQAMLEKKKLKEIIATNNDSIETLKIERDVRDEQIETLVRTHAEEKNCFAAKLKSEGDKWLIQNNIAQQSVHEAIQHRRACFDLRNANGRRDKQIETLAGDNERLKAKLEDCEVEVARLSADVVSEQKSSAEVTMTDADMEFVNGPAEKWIEAETLKTEGWMGADGAYDLA